MNNMLRVDDDSFPLLLKQIKDHPKEIYFQGNYNEDIFNSCLAVVGSRNISSYGENITKKLVSEIASAGITIVSGFMHGVDCCAHESALDIGGRTIAVLGYGIEGRHASYNRELSERIIGGGGLIVSEYPNDFPADKWTFPRRNRIIAGLSKAVLVIEAAKESGSLITVSYASINNREVFAVPGQVGSMVSEGTNSIIKDGVAKMVTSSSDILEFFGLKAAEQDSVEKRMEDIHKKYSVEESQVFAYLCSEPLSLDEICIKIGAPASKAGYFLSRLELAGFIFEKEGRYFVS